MHPTPDAGAVSPSDLVAAGRALRGAGLSEPAVAAAEAIAPRQLDTVRLPLVHEALAQRDDSAAVLLRGFVYDDVVGEEELRNAVGSATLAVLRAVGLVVPGNGGLVATGRVVPFLGVLVAADAPFGNPEVVMPPGPTTMQLGRLLPDAGLGRVLDVATGPGSLALVAAARGGRVVGTDLSDRCLAFARFNAAMNGLEIEWRRGDLLAPVAGERFDLVVAQPPFIPRPETMGNVTFLHSGPMGDELVFALLAGLPGALTTGGIGLVRFDAPARDEPLPAQLRAHVPDDQADVIALSWRGATADQEAFMYAGLTDRTLGAEYAGAAKAYRQHLRDVGIERFVQAFAVVRRPEGTETWTAGLPLDAPPEGWPALVRFVAGLDLVGRADDDLLASRLAPLDRMHVYEGHSFADAESDAITVRPPAGAFAAAADIGDDMNVLLDAFSGGHTVGAVAAVHAELTGGALATSTPAVLELVREAIARGWLVPA